MWGVWWSFWWLIFPIGFFVFRAWDRWLSYQRSRHALEVMKQYAAQGKDPPPELAQQVREDAYGYDDYRGWWRHRHGRYWRGPPPAEAGPPSDPAHPAASPYWRGGRYWEWRSVLVCAAVAGAFWVASEYSYIPGADGIFRLVAIIVGCVAAANLALALFPSRFRDR